MSMIDVVRADMVAAMKAKEKEKKEVLSMLLADLKNYEINNRLNSLKKLCHLHLRTEQILLTNVIFQ